MNMKYKKLVIAIQSAMMTSLICSALPSYASDIELYKSPQTTQTTLMFMMDVSGSMGDEDRIGNLKRGMIKLLQGDVATGIEPLPDRLVTGLSEFSSPDRNGPFGRIKLEARPLGESESLGSKEIYKVLTPTVYSGIRTQTQIVSRTRTQTRDQTKSSRNGVWSDWSAWSSWSGWSGWAGSNFQSGTESVSGKVRGVAGVVQECVEWNNPTNVNDSSCKTWIDSVKTVTDLIGLNSSSSESYSFSNWSPTSNSSGWSEDRKSVV